MGAAEFDLWDVYERHAAAVVEEVTARACAHPVFGPLLRSREAEPEQLSRAWNAAALLPSAEPRRLEYRERMLRASPRGIALDQWSDIARNLRRAMVPKLIEAFRAEPARLTAVLLLLEDRVEELLAAFADAEVSSREERYRQLFEGHPLPTWVFDVETLRFLEVNDAAVRRYGYSRDEFLAMRITDIRPPEDAAEIERLVPTLGTHSTTSTRHRTRDGRLLLVEAFGHAFSFGGREARLIVVHDVTALRKSEEQVRQMQKMEAVGLLAGGIAHDFNNILTVIESYSDFTLSALDAAHPARSDVEQIKQAAEKAAALTGQLLTFSRRKVVAAAPVCLDSVIIEMDRMLRRVIGEDIALHTVPRRGLSAIRCDRSQLEQILLNLVVNARDAMPSGGTLVIETADVVHDGVPSVMLAVTDTGTGMDAATVARVFEPFFTTKEPGKGTGLGLSTVYGIVQQSGGTISVYSEPGRGTTFKLYFPAVRAEAAAPAAAPDPEVALARASTVLLVEDDAQVRAAIRRALDRAGSTVLEASSAGEALALSARHAGAIDLVVTDTVLPGKSGPELVAELSAQRPGLKVLFMSGYTDRAVVRTGMLPPGAQFIQKPFPPDAILARVRALVA